MAEKTIKLEVVTPERVVYSEDVDMVIARATEGDLGVLPGHTHLVTGLQIGVVRIKKDDTELKMAVGGGFMEITPDHITVLANTAEKEFEIDVERAYRAKERALQSIKAKQSEQDVLLAEIALKRAMVRLKAAGREE